MLAAGRFVIHHAAADAISRAAFRRNRIRYRSGVLAGNVPEQFECVDSGVDVGLAESLQQFGLLFRGQVEGLIGDEHGHGRTVVEELILEHDLAVDDATGGDTHTASLPDALARSTANARQRAYPQSDALEHRERLPRQ
jgi:hypothetical protein